MKIAVMVVAILGALAVGGLGTKWLVDFQKNQQTIAALTKMAGALGKRSAKVDSALKELEHTRTAAYLMIGAAAMALAVALCLGKLGKLASLALWAGAAAPAALAPKSLVAGSLLIVAGLLALFIRARRPTMAQTQPLRQAA